MSVKRRDLTVENQFVTSVPPTIQGVQLGNTIQRWVFSGDKSDSFTGTQFLERINIYDDEGVFLSSVSESIVFGPHDT